MPTIPCLIRTDRATNIKRLLIDSLTFNELLKLLPALRNVQSLCTDYQLHCDDRSDSWQQQIFSINSMLPKCIQLNVQLSDDMTFEHIEYLLQQTPNLRKLVLPGWYHVPNAKKMGIITINTMSKIDKV